MITTRIFAVPKNLNYLDAIRWINDSLPWLNEHVGETIAARIGAHNSWAGARPNPDDVPCWTHLRSMFTAVIDDDATELYMEWFRGTGWQIFLIEKQKQTRRIDVFVQIYDPISAVHFKLACL
jgi:hypothetical protein